MLLLPSVYEYFFTFKTFADKLFTVEFLAFSEDVLFSCSSDFGFEGLVFLLTVYAFILI